MSKIKQYSAFSLGIIAAKQGKTQDDNEFSEGTAKHEWWADGMTAAHDPQYAKEGVLLKDRPLYENLPTEGL